MEINWKLDVNDPYVWQIENSPFGVEKIDNGAYAPFRLWNNARVYIGYTGENNKRETVLFSTRFGAMEFLEKAYKEYLSTAITSA